MTYSGPNNTARQTLRTAIGLIRAVHPAPAGAVVALSLALAAILAAQSGLPPFGTRTWLTGLAVLGSQVCTGALNDWADRHADAVAQRGKPIPSGELNPPAALTLAAAGLAIQVGASLPLGVTALLLGLAAVVSAATYNLWLSKTPASVIPYLVSFGLLPLWVAAGVGVPLERVVAAPLLVAPFAAAAHLANAVRDYAGDLAMGRRSLAQVLGPRAALAVAWLVAMGVGIGVGAVLIANGRLGPVDGALGVIGLAAVAQGIGGARQLWYGMLVAAICWTAAWALATG